MDEEKRSGISSSDNRNDLTDSKLEAMQLENATSRDPHAQLSSPPPRYSKEAEAAVIRRLDWYLMPFIFILYSLSVLDRSNLGNARIAGLEEDLALTGKEYDWLATVFYIACAC